MKKNVLLLALLLMSAFTLAMARTFHVEKALHVKVKGEEAELKAGTSLDESVKITVEEGGVLVIVDKAAGKRWLVKKKYSGKVGSVAKDSKSDLCSTTKSLFYTTYSKPVRKEKKKDKQAGMSVIGGSSGAGLGGVVGTLPTKREWASDTTYRFLDEIESDSITFILVE